MKKSTKRPKPRFGQIPQLEGVLQAKKTTYWLVAIFVLTLTIRLVLAFSIDNVTYESYFTLRQAEHILQTGTPLYDDPLSYGGKQHTFLPLFHYVVAFFALFLPLQFVAKFLPNLLLATLPIIVYKISTGVTNNRQASLFSAFIAGFLPILFLTNALTAEALFLPLIFLTIYAFLNIKEKKHLYLYIGSFLALSFTSAATSLLIIGFVIYLLLSRLESKRINRVQVELILFSIFFFIWTQFLFFKNILLTEGISFIWRNIPSAIISEYFPKVSVAEAIVLVSAIPFLVGIFVVYQELFQFKNKKAFLLISFVVSTSLLAWFRLIEFKLSLAFFSVILAILFAIFYKESILFIKKTRLAKYKKAYPYILIGLILLTTVLPAIATAQEQKIPSNEEIKAFQWIKEHVPERSGVLALLEEGHLVTYYGNRKNMIDDRFGLVDDIDARFAAYHLLYSTSLETQALGALKAYKIGYIVLTPTAKEKFDITRLQYLSRKCFEVVYNNEVKIYRTRCIVRQGP